MRFYGNVGYGESQEGLPGSWSDVITEVAYRGDIIRNIARQEHDTNQLNDNLRVNNAISIVADQYAMDHFHLIKYVEFEGARWRVSAVEVKPPRLILNIGEVYNGNTP